MIAAVSQTSLVTFRRPADEAPAAFGERLRDVAAGVAGEPGARTVVLFVDDGAVGAPSEATALPPSFDGALLVDSPADVQVDGSAQVLVVAERRVMKARPRRTDGTRAPGFTILCPSVRAAQLSHDEFDAHWRDRHAPIHVASSPGTCHYEHLVLEPAPGVAWDGVGLLSFATEADYTDRLFGGPDDERAIYEDVARFLDLASGETLPASEFVYRESA